MSQRQLSILIPVYNWDVVQLVAALHRQCLLSDIDFEIRCYDDGSIAAFLEKNSALDKYEHVVYRILGHNIGRSRIRNLLANEAEYSFLLFLDCDSGIAHNNFILNYLKLIKENTILYGGRIYADQQPVNKAHLLHWYYGRYRETAILTDRKKAPYHSFMTNNFLIPKAIFTQIRFDERLLQYGHEDTLFGQEMLTRSIPIVHLDNPILHLGLENVNSFLEKTRQAMENLSFLYREHPELETHLLRMVNRLKKWHLDGLTLLILRKIHPLVKKNLLSSHPNLRALDLFKLYHFLEMENKNRRDDMTNQRT